MAVIEQRFRAKVFDRGPVAWSPRAETVLVIDHGFGIHLPVRVLLSEPPPMPLVPGLAVVFVTSAPNMFGSTAGRILPAETLVPFVYSAKVARAVDGDTLWFDVELWGPLTSYLAEVRVDGVNCPESHGPKAGPAGLAAAAFTADLLPVGTKAMITTRKVNARLVGHGEKVEVHGRYLASVTLPDGRDLAATLISSGHGIEYHGVGKVA